jgi:hypothetical protein
MRQSPDETLEMCSNVRQFSGEFFYRAETGGNGCEARQHWRGWQKG